MSGSDGPAPPGPGPYDRRTTVISRTIVRLVVPVIVLTAVALLVQGHNLPGGGFIGGVLTVAAAALVYVVFGADYLAGLVGVRAREDGAPLVWAYRRVLAVGLLLALASGLAPLLVGRPFATQAVVFVTGLPLFGSIEVASALAFDLGVYLTVVGALLVVVGEVGAE